MTNNQNNYVFWYDTEHLEILGKNAWSCVSLHVNVKVMLHVQGQI